MRVALLLPLALALVVCLVAGCERYDPLLGLNEAEREAVDRIGRDPYVDVWRTERDRDGHLIVWTRQGDGKARYRVVTPVEPEQDVVIEPLDVVRPVGR